MQTDSASYGKLFGLAPGSGMLKKKVYINDRLIGEARTWSEVHALIRKQGLLFVEKPGAAEGPSGFYVSGSLARRPSLKATKRRAQFTAIN